MAQQTINIGTAPNDGSGDTLRDGADKINANFTELYDVADALPATYQPLDSGLTAIAAATPIADGAHVVAGITIVTAGGIITALS